MGADLVSINCAADQKFLDSLMAGRGSYYIGFTDAGVEGTFRWSDGSDGSFTNWHPKEPNNNGGSEDCAIAIPGSGWNDLPCVPKYSLNYFPCEM